MGQLRREVLTWNEVDQLIDHLTPQFERDFEAMVMITRGGIIPGGLLAEALGVIHILTAAVDFMKTFVDHVAQELGRHGSQVWPR